MKRALILDLDNTIYPVSSIAEHLFERLFALLDEYAEEINYETLINAKDELTRRPYHWVADKYNFGEELKNKGIGLLNEITYNLPMHPFDEYQYVKSIPLTKFLVTTGFSKLQWSKVKMLDIENDFEEIHIVDPEISKQTKKDVFADIVKRYGYDASEVLVIGDDPESEIQAAKELGIDTFLFDPENKHPHAFSTYKASQLKDVMNFLF
ncbi:MAG: dUMP phosphatase [Mucilaginibacter sp.]|jgi:putative hydrolase of the HAD superfamily|nr:dUMP phosphatase [Mucilaginibacter sp.]